MQSYYSLKIDSSRLTQEQRHTLGEALLFDRFPVVYVMRNDEVFDIEELYNVATQEYYSWLDEELCCDDEGFTEEVKYLDEWGILHTHIDPEELEKEEEQCHQPKD